MTNIPEVFSSRNLGKCKMISKIKVNPPQGSALAQGSKRKFEVNMKIWIVVIGVGLYLYLVFIYFDAVIDLGESIIKVLCLAFQKVDQLVHKS